MKYKDYCHVSNGFTRERKCLKCQKMFVSKGPGNRLCDICVKSNSREVCRNDAALINNGRVVRKVSNAP